MSFLIRASYPNYYMIRLYAKEGREIFNKDNDDVTNTLEGNKPGTVIYTDNNGHVKEFPPRWYDMFYLLKLHDKEREDYFNLLLNEKEHHEELNKSRDAFWKNCQEYAQANPLWESNELITTLTKGDFTDEEISHKGRILLDLTRNCYPVPDFCIITSAAFNHPEHMPELIEHAIDNLEIMTGNKLGDSRHPLVFAIRCAMPQYIPGLMPTLLNIGMTREAYEGFRLNHAEAMANRVYLSTLHSICQMLKIEHRYEKSDIELSNEMQTARIEEMEQKIIATGTEGERTLHDAHYQAIRLILHVRDFYIENQDLILTFMQGKQAFPSFILQKMVWTIGNNESYPGVLYSHHSRTGSGCQIESYRNIFGEEIMTGDVTSEDRCYHNRNEIKDIFPAAVYFLLIQIYATEAFKLPLTFKDAEPKTWILPIFSLALPNISYYAMWLRRYMVDESTKDYVKLAEIKGLSKRKIMFRHVFRNAFVPLGQYLPTTLLNTVVGSIYVESLYSIPGMGGLLVDVVKRQDNSMVQAIVMLFAAVGIVGLILGDVMMSLLDPRISFTGKKGGR